MVRLGLFAVHRVQIVDLTTICLGDGDAMGPGASEPAHGDRRAAAVAPAGRRSARQIPANSGYYNAALKAMGEGDFGNAQAATGTRLHEGEEGHVRIAQAQVEMFTARYGEAAGTGRQRHDHDDPKLLCQLAVAQIQPAPGRGRRRPISSTAKARRKRTTRSRPAACTCTACSPCCTARAWPKPSPPPATAATSGGTSAGPIQDPGVAASCNNRGVMYLFQANYPNAKELFGWAGDI